MTDTITLPRAVIEQAIESMQGYAREPGDTQPCDAEQALRAALAQQASRGVHQDGPDFEDGPDSEGFSGPRPWNNYQRQNPQVAQQAEQVPRTPIFTTGHCKEKAKVGGCQLHNLQCSYPACDRVLAAAPKGGV